MKRISVPSECQTFHYLFDYLWRTVLEPTLANDAEGAHVLALTQHRIIEIIRNEPENIAYALSLLHCSVVRSYKGNSTYQKGLKQFESRVAEAFKAEIKVELKATKKLADVRSTAKPVSQSGELFKLFEDLWQFLQPAISENPEVGYAITIMHRRIGEAIERGPKGIVCAISLLTGNIQRAFKYTKAHKEHKVSFNTYVAHLAGDVIPQKSRGLI